MNIQALLERLERSGVIAVVSVEDSTHAVPVARALLAGGVDVIELTLRTDAALESIRRICAEVPGMTVGAGTVLNRNQLKAAVDAGAAFGVAPGCTSATIDAAHEFGLPFAPGVMTPSDIETAVAQGCRLLKFFPAATAGGIRHLSAIAAPFAHLGLRYIPLGGISPLELANYLASPHVIAVGGSWLARPEQIRLGQWSLIQQRAEEATRLVRSVSR